MKSAGLSSTYSKMLRKTTKISVFAAQQDSHLAAKEKQKTLRMQAAQAQFERQKKEATLQSEEASPPSPL